MLVQATAVHSCHHPQRLCACKVQALNRHVCWPQTQVNHAHRLVTAHELTSCCLLRWSCLLRLRLQFSCLCSNGRRARAGRIWCEASVMHSSPQTMWCSGYSQNPFWTAARCGVAVLNCAACRIALCLVYRGPHINHGPTVTCRESGHATCWLAVSCCILLAAAALAGPPNRILTRKCGITRLPTTS
jgi:hypothetical protein